MFENLVVSRDHTINALGGRLYVFCFFFKSITENQAKENLNYLFLKIKERHLAVGAARREVQEELVTHLVREIFVRGKIVRGKIVRKNCERKIARGKIARGKL